MVKIETLKTITAIVAAWLWLGLLVWTLGGDPSDAWRSLYLFLWLGLGLWAWRIGLGRYHERRVMSLLDFILTVSLGALAMCLASVVALWRWLRSSKTW